MSTVPSIKFEPLAYKTSIVYSQLPTNGDADLDFTRNTACDVIDINGDSTEVAVNIPRYDYRDNYIAPLDNSYYSFDSLSSIPLSKQFQIGSNDVSFSMKMNTGSLALSSFLLTGASSCFGVFIRDTGKFVITLLGVSDLGDSTPTLLANTDYTIGYTKTGTVGKYFLNGIVVDTVVDNNNYIGLISSIGTIGLSIGRCYNTQLYNLGLSDLQMLDIYNNLPIVTEYKRASSVSFYNIDAGTFVSGTYSWTPYGSNTIANVSNQLEITIVTDENGAINYLRDTTGLNKPLVVGKKYRISFDAKIIGTANARMALVNTLEGVIGTNVLTSVMTRYSIDFTCAFVTATHLRCVLGQVSDVITLDNITIVELGNVLNLSTGKTDSIWYDLDHNITGNSAIATLSSSNNFGNNIYGLNICPGLLLEPSFTTYFKNSRTPITQTVTGLSVGTTYTVNCKGEGIITVSETGGEGVGGAATEVYPFTYTATETSVLITLSVGNSFDFVQMTNTDFAYNHVDTLGATVTKVKDTAIKTGLGTYIDNDSFVLEVEARALHDSETTRVFSLSDGTLNNRAIIAYTSASNTVQFAVVFGGVNIYSHLEVVNDTTIDAVYKLKVSSSDFGSKINGIEVDSQASGGVIEASSLIRIGFDAGDGLGGFDAKTKKVIVNAGISTY